MLKEKVKVSSWEALAYLKMFGTHLENDGGAIKI